MALELALHLSLFSVEYVLTFFPKKINNASLFQSFVQNYVLYVNHVSQWF